MRTPRSSIALVLVASALGSACVGIIEDEHPVPSTASVLCEGRPLPPQPLRRLSSTQYHHTLRDLFGADLARPLIDGSLFPATVVEQGFEGDADVNVVSTLESNAIEDNAERIASVIAANPKPYLQHLLPCPAGTDTDGEIDACIDRFITTFGLRAYRRPVTEAESHVIRGVYDAVRPEQGGAVAFASVVQFFVQAPALLYRAERGADAVTAEMARLTDYEMATRLSYLFLESMPDETLLAAAAAGRLSTPSQIAIEARRLLADPRALDTLVSFHTQWLHLDKLASASKDASAFPAFTADVQRQLGEETDQFVRHVMQNGDATIASLLGSSTFPVTSTLASFYGVAAPGASTTTWVPVTIPNRRGLFTQASVMASLAGANRTSPIHRGAFFRREILCNVLPGVPGNVDTQGPLQSTATLPTARERLAPLTQRDDCAGCHQQINPVGLAFENYDGVGRWRDQEMGARIDAAGAIDLGSGAQSFASPMALMDLVADSDMARDCYAVQLYRAALGRRELTEDQCALTALKESSAASGGDVRELLVALTQSPSFLFRRQTE